MHYTTNQDICGQEEVVLIDAGAEYRGYASDITRSWPISGKFSDAQREIYQIVLDAQEAAIEACQVGAVYTAPHDAAHVAVLAEGLIKLGVITQTIDDALDMDTGQLKQWYMHNTSHWIGLDVHDAGVYKPGGEPRTLEPGMCLTVEPVSILVHGGPMWIVQSATNIGIRIEDDVLITNDGPKILTEDCPKTIGAIEAIVGQSFEVFGWIGVVFCSVSRPGVAVKITTICD